MYNNISLMVLMDLYACAKENYPAKTGKKNAPQDFPLSAMLDLMHQLTLGDEQANIEFLMP